MYCVECGNKLTEEIKFCPYCGVKVSKLVEPEEDKDSSHDSEKDVRELPTQEIKPVAETMKVMAGSYPLGLHYFFDPLRKYGVFSGRATRKEYWMFYLYMIIIGFVLGFIEGEEGLLSSIFLLATFIPSIAVGVRRMHDVDYSGWSVLLPIVNLILLCSDGTKGDNKYGPDPKDR